MGAAAADQRGSIEEQEAAALKIQNEARRKAALEEVAKRKAAAAADPSAASKGNQAKNADAEAYDAKLMAGKAGKVDVSAVKAKTKGALLGGLKSGALEAAVAKKEAAPAAEEAEEEDADLCSRVEMTPGNMVDIEERTWKEDLPENALTVLDGGEKIQVVNIYDQPIKVAVSAFTEFHVASEGNASWANCDDPSPEPELQLQPKEYGVWSKLPVGDAEIEKFGARNLGVSVTRYLPDFGKWEDVFATFLYREDEEFVA